jgi:3-isopropylmalate/(R)-2-methylmalate dehydratase large subunit
MWRARRAPAMNVSPMASTLALKILARASGAASLKRGEIATCKVDLAMMHDSGGPRRVKPMLEKLGVGVWDPSKIVLVTDHYVPAVDAESAAILDLTRKWAAANGVARFHDMQGICHVILPENGYLRPGMFAVGGDSHSPTGGAFGAYMFGIGATEMAGVLATGEIWVRAPGTHLVRWKGRLGKGLSAKDIMLKLCRAMTLSAVKYDVVEFAGPAIEALPMIERLVLANMSAELGAQTGLIAPDAVTLDFLRNKGVALSDVELARWRSDPDAEYAKIWEFDAGDLAPQIAAPHSPENSDAASAHKGTKIHQAYIGACTGAKLVDLRMAAQVLKGRKVATGTRLLIAPASQRTTTEAASEGTLATLLEAGAILLPTGCGACAGYGAGVLAEGETCLSSTARNFKGRMGHAKSFVYLGSPYSVAAGAVAGEIVDPREFLS